MFGFAGVISALRAAQQNHDNEMKMLDGMRHEMTPEAFKEFYADYTVKKEKAQQYATEERRHQELCRSIRSTSFWRF